MPHYGGGIIIKPYFPLRRQQSTAIGVFIRETCMFIELIRLCNKVVLTLPVKIPEHMHSDNSTSDRGNLLNNAEIL